MMMLKAIRKKLCWHLLSSMFLLIGGSCLLHVVHIHFLLVWFLELYYQWRNNFKHLFIVVDSNNVNFCLPFEWIRAIGNWIRHKALLLFRYWKRKRLYRETEKGGGETNKKTTEWNIRSYFKTVSKMNRKKKMNKKIWFKI